MRILYYLFTFIECLKVGVREVVIDSPVKEMQWIGPNRQTLIILSHTGRLYISADEGLGWTNVNKLLRAARSKASHAEDSDSSSTEDSDSDSKESSTAPAEQILVADLKVHPKDKNVVLAVGKARDHFVSEDAGKTWRKIKHHSKIERVLFHATRSKWAAISSWTPACFENEVVIAKKPGPTTTTSKPPGPCVHLLYITKDMGLSFQLVTDYMIQFAWGIEHHGQADRLYFSHYHGLIGNQSRLLQWTSEANLSFTEDAGQTIVESVVRGNKFGVVDKFIFCARVKEDSSNLVELVVSDDGGVTYRKAILPEDVMERSYAILDTSQEAVLLHVDHGHVDGVTVGNVYVSDETGSRYTLSLPNNVRGTNGDCDLDKVAALDGIYIANYVSKEQEYAAESESVTEEGENDEADTSQTDRAKKRWDRKRSKEEPNIRTVITFDKGGLWRNIPAPRVDSLGNPTNCNEEEDCWLHLHGISTFDQFTPFYSQNSAVGIILGTGNIGRYLRREPGEANTFLSRDGGATWVEAHKGSFIYELGDHGGLILMTNRQSRTRQVVFSWNEGNSWLDFDTSPKAFEVDNVVTRPGNGGVKFIVYGMRDNAGVLYFLDFSSLGTRVCDGVFAAGSVASDYELWSPTDGRTTERCLLGRHLVFTRRKAISECWNGEEFKRPIKQQSCPCRPENYECELGFSRSVGEIESPCSLTNYKVAIPESCTPGDVIEIPAYRKVVGDGCNEDKAIFSPSTVQYHCGGVSSTRWNTLFAFLLCLVGYTVYFFRGHIYRYKIYLTNVHSFAKRGFQIQRGHYAVIGQDEPETQENPLEAQSIDGASSNIDELIQLNRKAEQQRMDFYNEADIEDILEEDRSSSRSPVRINRVHTAAEHVPRLCKPPEDLLRNDPSLLNLPLSQNTTSKEFTGTDSKID